jgi:hypothetical protein
MKQYHVNPCNEPMPIWSMAEVMTDFTFAWENKPAPKTEFRALWNSQELHFRFDCQDDDLVLPDGVTVKDRALGSDRVEIFFTPDLSLDPYYCLEMTPRGDALAYKAKFYREIDWEWKCMGLYLDAQIQDNHYTVTGRIPLRTLFELNVLKPNLRELMVGVYRAEFCRNADGSVHSGWMPWVKPHTLKPDFHVPASFGVFELVGGSV